MTYQWHQNGCISILSLPYQLFPDFQREASLDCLYWLYNTGGQNAAYQWSFSVTWWPCWDGDASFLVMLLFFKPESFHKHQLVAGIYQHSLHLVYYLWLPVIWVQWNSALGCVDTAPTSTIIVLAFPHWAPHFLSPNRCNLTDLKVVGLHSHSFTLPFLCAENFALFNKHGSCHDVKKLHVCSNPRGE